MKEPYTADVLARAAQLAELERAAEALMLPRQRWDFRAGLIAAMAVLMSLLPTVSAAQCLWLAYAN